jgi:hypothetical protein
MGHSQLWDLRVAAAAELEKGFGVLLPPKLGAA